MPLIITHGWPGSFTQMLKILPLLTDPGAHGFDPADSFDVIVPSLPGFGFSDRPANEGMNAFRVADIWVELMHALDGKVAVITGGNSGIGLVTARRFVKDGAYVFITGRRQAELDSAVSLTGKNVTAVQGDVSKPEDPDHL
jgi:pimeloyl-ACP methyl ester carboxylesterase